MGFLLGELVKVLRGYISSLKTMQSFHFGVPNGKNMSLWFWDFGDLVEIALSEMNSSIYKIDEDLHFDFVF